MEIPSDVLGEILVRLPVKKLLQLRRVSKSWCSLISSPSFISAVEYRDNNTNKTRLDSNSSVLLRYYLPSERKMRTSLYKYLGHPLPPQIAEVQFPLDNNNNVYDFCYVVGSCNGLLCYYTRLFNVVRCLLWNCSIRKYIHVPVPHGFHLANMPRYVLGFGSHYQDHKYEFKILRLTYLLEKIPPVADIYHLSTNSWRPIQSSVTDNVRCVVDRWSSTQAFLHEALHWIAELENRKKVILVFHIANEVFSEMEVPESVANSVDYRRLSLFLHNYGQTETRSPTLCLVEQNPPGGIGGRLLHGVCYIWVMKEYGVVYSWIKQFTVDMRPHGGLGRVLDSTQRGQILIETVREELISYCTYSHRIKFLGIRGYRAITPYKKSLFLLNM